MKILKETDEILVAICPKWRSGANDGHDTVIIWSTEEALYQYFKELFSPGIGVKEG